MPTYVCKYCGKTTDEYRKNYRHNMGCKARGGAPNEGDRKPLVRCSTCDFIGPSAREVKFHEASCSSGVTTETAELPEEAQPEVEEPAKPLTKTARKKAAKAKKAAKK